MLTVNFGAASRRPLIVFYKEKTAVKVLSKPVTETFTLESDPDGVASVTIRQATFGDEKAVADLTRKRTRKWKEGVQEIALEDEYSFPEEQSLKIYLTLADATGFFVVDKDGNEKPAFQFADFSGVSRPKNKIEFFATLDRLSPKVVEEIYEKVKKVNPQWDPKAQGE